jgi:aryl-alcohol dehydrogenase-like predicted oxidoreductase
MLATSAGDDHERAAVSGLPTSTLGRTGIRVTKLGFGAMELRRRLDPAAVERLLQGVLDAGINLIDTAPDYGRSEEHIGRWLSHRRDEFFLASKCGCPVGRPDPPPGQRREHFFDRANVRAGVEQSLRRMQTDRLDLVQFHNNPSRSTLEANDSVAELLTLRDEGKIRFLGMSGTLPNLADHIAMGVFDVFQLPYSAVDRKHESAISDVARAGAGTIIRGGVAQGLRESAPFERAAPADLLQDMSPMEFMLRFTISHPDVHTTIVGTADHGHLVANVAAASAGGLPADVYRKARERFVAPKS